MRARLQLLEFQIALLELKAANMNSESIHIPGHARWSLGGFGPVAYAERERRQRKRDSEWMLRRIKHLKKQHYIETVKEGERRLLRLTSKGEYEVLRLQFMLQMHKERQEKWGGTLWLAMYDVPESKRAYRSFFNRLLKQAGFIMLQRSIWVSRYNPRPAIDELLRCLDLERYFELLEVDCRKCSTRFLRKLGLVISARLKRRGSIISDRK